MECKYNFLVSIDDTLDTYIQLLDYTIEGDTAYGNYVTEAGIEGIFKTNDKIFIKQLENIKNDLPVYVKILKSRNSYMLLV